MRALQIFYGANVQLGKSTKKPTKQDKAEFEAALRHSAGGHLPVRMWLFYEFLVHNGELEGSPRLDKNLFFYCEVLKFKEASHVFADEETLRRKVQSMFDCYVDTVSAASAASPQIDVGGDVQQKTSKAVQRYVAGRDVSSSLFDDAQASAFNEMLPYWITFSRHYTPPPVDRPIPLTRQMRLRRRKLEEILRWKPTSARSLRLPRLTSSGPAAVNSLSFTISDGLRWKDAVAVGGDNDGGSSRDGALSAGDDTHLTSVINATHDVVVPALRDVSNGNTAVSAEA